MSNLSEEEIIKDIKEILELAKEEIKNNDENITVILDLQDLISLKKLYDLYNKEKEKNKKVNEINFRVNKNLLETAEKLEQEKEKNKELENTLKQTQDSWYKDTQTIQEFKRLKMEKFEDKFISKDKLKELQKKVHNILDENGFTRAYQILVDKEFEKILGE